MFQQETEASTLLGGNRLSADPKGKLWEFWPHFPLSLQHCDYTTTRRLTVVVGLVLRPQPRDGQGGSVGGAVKPYEDVPVSRNRGLVPLAL